MKKQLIPATAFGAFALAVSVAAQSQPATPKAPDQAPRASAPAAVTVEGCLMREDDVPGRKANVAEKVGIGDDYILTSTKIVKGNAPGAAAAAKPGEAVGTSGTSGAMYDLNGIDKETLKRHLNKRVEVDGTFKNVDGGVKGNALIEIDATSIRAAKGDCSK
jgi:hypothetical protein